MSRNNELVLVDEKNLENKIYIIRGQKVMLDRDLAKIYGYTTSLFNRQVQRNIEKFDNDFMFQLTKEETILSRCQNGTLKNMSDESRTEKEKSLTRCKNSILKNKIDGRGTNIKYLPYVFTEKGIYMLMTVLKGDLATKQSIALIRLFDSMKNYIQENRTLISNNELELRTKLLERDVNDIKQDNKIIKMDLNKVMEYFEDKDSYKHFLILDGKKLEADIAYRNIIKQAKSSIICIDDYISLKSLELLSYATKNVSITIFSNNKAKPSLKQSMINDFNNENKSNKLSLYKPSVNFHDRYLIIDYNTKNETIYHLGASIKDAGNKISTITKLELTKLYRPIIEELLKNI